MKSILAQRLKLCRENKKLTQIDVYNRTGINNKTLSGYENDVSDPDLETLKILAGLYEVTTDYLLGIDDNTCRSDNPNGADRKTSLDLPTEDPALLDLARQLKNLPETDRKEIESYIQYKAHLNKNNEHAATKAMGN